MAASRVVPIALRAAPLATLAVLAAWTAADVGAIGGGRPSVPLLALLVFGVAVLLVAAALRWSWVRPIGLASLVVVYGITHAFFLGVQLAPALVFVVLLVCHVELRILETRFASVYEATLAPSDRLRIRSALGRAAFRLAVAASLSIIVPLLAGNLATAGVVPVTTIPTALLLSAGLVVIVLLLVLLPARERRTE